MTLPSCICRDSSYLSLYAHCGARDSQGYKVGNDSSKDENSPAKIDLDNLIDVAYWDAMTNNPSWDNDKSPPRCECNLPGAPDAVHLIPRLRQDVDALKWFFIGAAPLQVLE